MAITLRGTKGSELTFSELDGNFTDLEGQILSGPTYFATVAALEADTTTIAEYRTKYGATGIVKVTTFAEGYQYHLDLEQLETHHIVNAQGVEFVSLQSDWPAFGADATGATDTTAKIVTAIEWAVSREVPSRIGEGTFQVSGQILDYADRVEGFPKIVGAGRNITTLTLQGEIIAPVFSVYGDVTAYGSTQHGSGLSFEDFTVVGDGTNIQNVFDLAILSSFDFKTVNCFNCRGANLRMRECWEGNIDAQFVRGGNCFSLPYDASTGTVTAGDTITGATSGATANVMRVYGGYLDVSSVVGTFADNEVVNAPSGTVTLNIPTGIVGAETPAVLLDYFFATDITNSACNNIVFHGTAQIEASLHRAMEWYDGTRKVSYSGKIHLLLGSAYDFEAVLLQGCMNSQIGPGADISWSGIIPSVKIMSGPAFIGAENSVINSDVSGGVDIVSGNRMIVVGNTGDIATSRTSLVTITGGTDALVHSNQYSGGSSQVEWGGVGFSGRVQPFEAAGNTTEADLQTALDGKATTAQIADLQAQIDALVSAGGGLDGTLVSVDDNGSEAQLFIPTAAADGELVSFAGYSTDYLGTNLTVAAVEAGVVCVDRISVAGTAADENTLTATPGIWFRPGDPIAAPTYVQKLDGTPISGGTGLTWDVVQTGVVQQFTIEETYGGVTVPSLQTEIPAIVAAAYPDFISGSFDSALLEPIKTVNLSMAGNNASQDVVVMFGGWTAGLIGNKVNAITLDGVAASSFVTQESTSLNGNVTGYARFPAGSYSATSPLVMTFDDDCRYVGASCYNIPPSSTVSTLDTAPETTRSGSSLSGNVSSGNGVIAVSFVQAGSDPDWTGVTEDYVIDTNTGEWFSSASEINVATATPLSITHTGVSTKTAAIAVKVVV